MGSPSSHNVLVEHPDDTSPDVEVVRQLAQRYDGERIEDYLEQASSE